MANSIMDLSQCARFALMMAGENILRHIETTAERRQRQEQLRNHLAEPARQERLRTDAKANLKKTMHKMRSHR